MRELRHAHFSFEADRAFATERLADIDWVVRKALEQVCEAEPEAREVRKGSSARGAAARAGKGAPRVQEARCDLISQRAKAQEERANALSARLCDGV